MDVFALFAAQPHKASRVATCAAVVALICGVFGLVWGPAFFGGVVLGATVAAWCKI
jgi:hypothetical protein